MTLFQLKHHGVQGVRHLTRLAVLLVIVAIVYLSLYAHFRAARAVEDAMRGTDLRSKLIRQVDRRVSEMDDPQAFLDGYKGTLWSLRVAGLDLTDPLAAAEATATAKTIYWPLLLEILIPVTVALLLGRIFCSWMCPAGLLFELADKLRRPLRWVEIKPATVKCAHGNKYVVLGVGLAAAAVLGVPIFALIYPPAVVSRLVHNWVFGTTLTGMLMLLGAIVAIELFVSPRWFCRSVCPGGALYGLIGVARVLRVKLDEQRCTACAKCAPACPMGLNPVADSTGIECDNCGACLPPCPEKALHYGLSRPRLRAASRQKCRGKAVSAAAVALLILLWPQDAGAHHILGLPHYSYQENYPQVPTLEYPAVSGPYDILMTSYPGKPTPGEAANVAFYVKNRDTGEPYDRPLTVRVLRTYTFGSNSELVPATKVRPFDKTHKLTVTFPDDGEFVVELSLQVEGQLEVIPFLLVAGEPTSAMSVLIAVGVGLVVFFVVVRAVRIKRARRAAAASAWN